MWQDQAFFPTTKIHFMGVGEVNQVYYHNSFNKYLLSFYFVPGTVLNICDVSVNIADEDSCS